MNVLKIRLDEHGEMAIGSAGLSLTDLLLVVVLGVSQETVRGTEIKFDLQMVTSRIGVIASARMHRLDGTKILVIGGRIRECRRAVRETISGEVTSPVNNECKAEGRNNDDK